MRVLICGSRTWRDPGPIDALIYGLVMDYGRLTIIHGDAKGADSLAASAGRALINDGREVTVRAYPADWERHGRAAGPIRNQQMLDAEPDLVYAFTEQPPTTGTADMIRRAQHAGIPVIVVSHATPGHPT